MKCLVKSISILFVFLAMAASGHAQTSVYTKLDFEKTCTTVSEYEAGATMLCAGHTGYPVIFSEGDLRQMVRFGHVNKLDGQWESFDEFNRVNDTIEWRLTSGTPKAAILRWFIENQNSNGETDKSREGQVLVISTIGTHENPVSCVVGYVDARANENANILAQEIADTKADHFRCGKDKAGFYGTRGEYSGTPSSYFE